MSAEDLQATWRALFAQACARIDCEGKSIEEARTLLLGLADRAEEHGISYSEAMTSVSGFIRSRYQNEWRGGEAIAPVSASEKHRRASNFLRRFPGFILTPLVDLLREPEEEVTYVVAGMLPSGGMSALVAKPKVGKSTLARQLALAVARGEPFFGRRTIPGPVFYLALEDKRSEVRAHFREMGAGDGEVYVHFGGTPENPLADLRRLTDEIRPVLVIVDPLFRMTRVRDANDYAQVLAALEPLLTFARETGAHVLVVHHAGKGDRSGGDAILGSTAILGTVDTAILLKRGDRYRTISTVQRYGADLEETVLDFDPGTRTSTLGEVRHHADENRIAGEIEQLLRGKTSPATEEEVLVDVEGKTGPKRKALRRLVRGNIVERTGEGRKGRPFVYRLNPRSVVPEVSDERGNENRTSAEEPRQYWPDSRSPEIVEAEGDGNEKPDIANTTAEPVPDPEPFPDKEMF